MSSVVPFTFNAVKLQIVTIDSKEWCRAKKVCKALEYKKDPSDVMQGHCSTEKITH